jgi:hypothetical protein
MPSLPTEIKLFLLAFVSHWQSYITGGVVTAVITLVERWREKTLPKRVYFIVFAVTFAMAAFFMAWRDQFERAETLQIGFNAKPVQPVQVILPPNPPINITTPPATVIQGEAQDPLKKVLVVLIRDLGKWHAQQLPTITSVLSGNVSSIEEGKAKAESIQADFTRKFEARLRNLEQELNRRGFYDEADTVEDILRTNGFTVSLEREIAKLNTIAGQL